MSQKNENKDIIYSAGEKVLCFHGPLLYEAKCLDVRTDDPEITYFVHYQGWNKNWDEWVTARRMYKYDDAGLRKQNELEKLAKSGKKLKILRKSDLKNQPFPAPDVIAKVEKALRPEDNKKDLSASSAVMPEETKENHSVSENAQTVTNQNTDVKETIEQPKSTPHSNPPEDKPPRSAHSQSNIRKKKSRPYPSELAVDTEEGFLSKPQLTVVFPNQLRAWLVDDWDLITKQSRLFNIPARKSVASILDDYREMAKSVHQETLKEENSQAIAEELKTTLLLTQDLKLEFTEGIKTNFNFILGSQLLYKFERLQYADILKNNPDKEMVDIYGPMHLLRLLVKLRDLITFLRVDRGSLNLLERLIADFISFLDRNLNDYFVLDDYTMATTDYLRLAMC